MNISIFNALKDLETIIASQMLILITFALKCKGTDRAKKKVAIVASNVFNDYLKNYE